jgi:hypothetical protein
MRKIIILALMSISLMACNNDNEKAMQDALNKAGIKISQQDSIIAAQAYRCNYIITYKLDTAYLKTTNGVLSPCKGNRDSIQIPRVGLYAVMDTVVYQFATPPPYVGIQNTFSTRGGTYTFRIKNATIHQLDSALASTYSKNYELKLIDKSYAYGGNKIVEIKSKNLFRYTYVASHAINKDYNNLYNVKQDSIK